MLIILDSILLMIVILRAINGFHILFGCSTMERRLKCDACPLLFKAFASAFIWLYDFRYDSESPTDVHTEDLENYCGTSEIIWTQPIAFIPWYFRIFSIPLLIRLIVFFVPMCFSWL